MSFIKKLSLQLALLLVFSPQVCLAQRLQWRPLPVRNGFIQLEVGQVMTGMQTSFRTVSERFSSQGLVEPLGLQFNSSKKWKAVRHKRGLSEYVSKNQIDPEHVALSTEYKVVRQEISVSPYWAFGLSDRWVLSAEMPIVKSSTRIEGRSSSSSEYRHYLKAQGETVTNQQSNVETVNRTDLGDVILSSHYLAIAPNPALESTDFSFGIFQLVQFPGAKPRDLASDVDTTIGGGSLGLGAGFGWIWKLARPFSLRGYLSHLMQFEDKIDIWSEDNEEDIRGIRRNLGDMTSVGVDAVYQMTYPWNLGVGYTVYQKSPDRYWGIDGERLASLEGEGQALAEARLHLEYGSNSKLALARLELSTPLVGKEAEKSPLANLEFALKF